MTTRDALELPAVGPVRHVLRAIERSGAIVVGLPIESVEVTRVKHHHGVSAWPEMNERPVIGFCTTGPGDRQRHTLSHELAHLVLHRGLVDPDRDYEGEATQFAGAFLMPTDDAAAAFDHPITLRYLADLKTTWGVSIAGLVMRAHQLGAINHDRVESLFKQISARGWRKVEPIVVQREQPALLPRLLNVRFGDPTDWRLAAKELDLPPHLLREMACVGERDQRDHDYEVVDLDAGRRRRGQAR